MGYPRRNLNRPRQLGIATAILVKIHFPGEGLAVSWPDPQTAQAMFSAVQTLSERNGYGRGYSVQFQINPTSGENPEFFEIALPGKIGRLFTPIQMLDALEAFAAKYPEVQIHSYDRILFITPPGTGGYFAQAIGHYAHLTEDAGIVLGPNEFAVGVLHEMFHGYAFDHANTLDPATGAVVTYGDMYDIMGEVSYLGWRFNAQCYPTGVTRSFAPWDGIHLNPIHKWQLGWLDDADIRVVRPGEILTGTSAIPLAPIASSSGVRAIQIEREIDAMDRPISLLVYWRENEPQIRDGVCIGLVSREQTATATRLLDFVPGPASPGQSTCFMAGKPIPARNVSLRFGAPPYTDPVTGTKIWCAESPAGGRIEVRVDNSAQTIAPLADMPVLELTSAILESGKVISQNDVIDIYMTATNPDRDPQKIGFQDIDRVEVKLQQGEAIGGGSAQPVYFDDGSTTILPEVKFFIEDPTSLRIPAAKLRQSEDPGNTTPMRKAIAVVAEAFTRSRSPITGRPRRVSGKITFLIDQAVTTGG